MSEIEYDDKDVCMVGWPVERGDPEVPSTKQVCHKCGRLVWISHGSMNTALDACNKSGGKLYFCCLMCVPGELQEEIELGDEQKEEMLAHGFDIEKVMRESGKSLSQLAQEVIQKAERWEEMKNLHRAANPGGCKYDKCRVCYPNHMEDGGAWAN